MESRFKMRISRMFRSSFGSCKPRHETDVIETKPVFVVENRQDFNSIDPLNPKVKLFPSMCRPRLEEEEEPFRRNDTKEVLRRRKVSDTSAYFISGGVEVEGRTCPPVSPISPFNNMDKHRRRRRSRKPQKPEKPPKPQKPKKYKKPHKTKSKKKGRSRRMMSLSSSSGEGWFTSEEEEETEDETETFFSSKSFSSDSSESRKKERSHRRRNSEVRISPLLPEEKKVVEESFAVVKRSRDPYSDFRISMVEMIVEKQLFSAKDLERLLHCFLSLNSYHHHRVIVEVFTEIWDALFSN